MTTWLEQQTGLTDRQWIEYVQEIIAVNTVPSTDPNHGNTEVLSWMVELTEKVNGLIATNVTPAPGHAKIMGIKNTDVPTAIDENMWTARVLSAVLAAWVVQW